MSKFNDDLFTKNYPSIDLHGETRYTMIAPLNIFIDDNIKLKNKNVTIIHGRGNGILKQTTHEFLKKDKRVIDFYVGFFNPGCTIVELKVDKTPKK